MGRAISQDYNSNVLERSKVPAESNSLIVRVGNDYSNFP
jgi:hypothetical protein